MKRGSVWFVAVHLCIAQTNQDALLLHSERAQTAQQKGDYQTAAEEWDAIVKLAPGVAEAYSNLGMMRHFSRQYAGAIEAFRSASALNPKLVGPHLFAGIDYYLIARSRDAVPQLKLAVQLSPEDPMARKWLAMSYFQAGEFEASARELNTAFRSDPHDTELLFYLSRAYMKMLFRSYETIRTVDSNSPFLKALRGDNTALPTPNKAVGVASSLQASQLDEAFTLATRLVHDSPADIENWYWLGKAAEALAQRSLDRFLTANPSSYRVHQLRAEYAQATGNDAGAVDEFRAAIAQNSEAAQLHESLGNIFMSSHQYERALQEYEAELKINSYALISLERTGQCYAALHDPDKAMVYLKRALSIDAGSYEALRALGKVYYERSDFLNAVKNYHAAAEANSAADPAIFFQLGQAYKQLGKTAEANQWLKKFREASEGRRALAQKRLATAPE